MSGAWEIVIVPFRHLSVSEGGSESRSVCVNLAKMFHHFSWFLGSLVVSRKFRDFSEVSRFLGGLAVSRKSRGFLWFLGWLVVSRKCHVYFGSLVVSRISWFPVSRGFPCLMISRKSRNFPEISWFLGCLVISRKSRDFSEDSWFLEVTSYSSLWHFVSLRSVSSWFFDFFLDCPEVLCLQRRAWSFFILPTRYSAPFIYVVLVHSSCKSHTPRVTYTCNFFVFNFFLHLLYLKIRSHNFFV